jgi:hypothetical protein
LMSGAGTDFKDWYWILGWESGPGRFFVRWMFKL